MRPLLIPAAIAIALTDWCGGDTVRALSPFIEPGPAQCENSLAGVWIPEDSGAKQVWAIVGPSDWEEDCAKLSQWLAILAIGDTGLARALLDPRTLAAFNGDDTALAAVHADPRREANWAGDSAALARLAEERLSELRLDLTVGRIGGELFVDLSRSESDERGPLGGRLSIATHGLWHLAITKEELTLTPLHDYWLLEGLDSGWISLPFTRVQGARILTSPTDSLRRFVLHHARDTLAFAPGTAMRLRRMQQ